MAESARDLLKRWEKLSTGRQHWLEHWDDLAAVMLPRRLGFATEITPGERLTENQYDNTPIRAARGLANAIGSMLRPEGQQWFFLTPEDGDLQNDDEAAFWLADTQRRLTKAFNNPKARFRQASGETDLDLVVFGTADMFVGRARTLDHLQFRSLHLKDVVIGYDESGKPDTHFRQVKLTLRQAEQRFGRDALSDASRDKLENDRNTDEEIKFLHAVTPRKNGREDADLAANLPFAEVWIEIDAEKLVEEKGFHEFPFVVPRWDTTAGEDYGRSPGMIALPDANTLQAMGETILVAGQRNADPPLFAPSDGSFSTFNTFPGGVSYYDAELARDMRGSPVFPLETGGQLPISRDMQGDTREQVMAAFFKNILNLPVDGPDMTATEVIERKEEFIREIGAVFGRLETDYTGPMVERAFNVMLRAGGFLPIPESLQGRNVTFEYESPVKKVREQVEAREAQQWVAEAIEIGQVRPSVLDRVNLDEYVQFRREAAGIPQRLEASDEEVARRRQRREQARQAEEQAQTVERGAEVANKAAPLLQGAGG